MLGHHASPPAPIRKALEQLFSQPIDGVRVIEHSLYARLHLGVRATTRRERIYLQHSADEFWRDPELVLHEYFHVLAQWQPRRLTIFRYLRECWHCGYWNNRFEIEARAFASAHRARFERLLAEHSPNGHSLRGESWR
jgi:hypothetical protein